AVVLKRFAVETLDGALRGVREGHVSLPSALQSALTARLADPASTALPSLEPEVVRLVAPWLQNPGTAGLLDISDATVMTHLNNILRKLEARDRVALTLYAIRTGIVGIHEKPQ